jgi:hypothetical protein
MDKAQNSTSGKSKWTVMVYMAGDNNLDDAALRDIVEMAKVGSTKDVNILVQLDRIEDKLTRRFRITKGGGFKKDCLDSFGDTNTGDPQVLHDFVKWAAEHYPADRHCLILWNHGSGWWEEEKGRTAGPDGKKRRHLFCHPVPQEHRSICYDDTSNGDALDNRELKVVLTGICTLLGKKIDILGMDACLMNMVEVAYQLRDSVNYIVGSEIEEPFDGWPYTEILTYLTAKPAKNAASFAGEIVKRYISSYKGQGETVTQSALNVGKIADLTGKVDALAAVLLASLDSSSAYINDAVRHSPRFYDDNYVDLACFARNLRRQDNADLREKADDLLVAMKAGNGKAILTQGKIGREVYGTCGLSIYFPAYKINSAYQHLDFATDCKWFTLLESYLS